MNTLFVLCNKKIKCHSEGPHIQHNTMHILSNKLQSDMTLRWNKSGSILRSLKYFLVLLQFKFHFQLVMSHISIENKL